MPKRIKYESKSKDVKSRMQGKKKDTLDLIGVFVEGEATNRTPVDTGNLRSSLTHETGNDEVIIGTNVEYAEEVEKGTNRNRAQPYLQPAIDDNRSRVQELVREVWSKL